MGSLARRVALAFSIACAPASAAQADDPLPLFPGPWRVAAEGFLHPAQPLHASVMQIHRLAHRRTNHGNLHVRGYKRGHYHHALTRCRTVAERVPKLEARAAYLKQAMRDRLVERGRAGDPRLALALLIHRGKPKEEERCSKDCGRESRTI